MVLFLQLDDNGDEARGSCGQANDSAMETTKYRRAPDGDAVDPDGTDAHGFAAPPAYSSISVDTYAHHHQASLQLDQPWSMPGTTNAGSLTGSVTFSNVSSGSSSGPHRESAGCSGDVDDAWGTAVKATISTPNDTSSGAKTVGTAKPPFANLLCAYPVVVSMVSHLDQTDLSNLSTSCRSVRLGLLQFRSQILVHALRCINEARPRDPTTAAPPRWFPPCARDLVAPCSRCLKTFCRNCTAKPGVGMKPPRRHRRLCRVCQTVSLSSTGFQITDEGSQSAASNVTLLRSLRRPCSCVSMGVHICRNCDQGQGSADMTYGRVWSWRSRYRNLGFGLGTGVGEGNEGVKCGRGADCLAARDLIVDMDCADAPEGLRNRGPINALAAANLVRAGEARFVDTPPVPSTPLTAMIVDSGILDAAGAGLSLTSPSAVASSMADVLVDRVRADPGHGDGNSQDGKQQSAGYYRQEIEGIGGVVKKKLKKRVRVGAHVAEYEDESQTGAFLERERTGAVRSWCAWCDRVIPSLADVEVAKTNGMVLNQ